jgi:hypothetical protein
MSLSDWQRTSARHDGGKAISNHKSHLSRTATAMRALGADASCPGNPLDGIFTGDELKTLRDATLLVDKACAALDAGAREAKRIKADYDKRVKEATAEYSKLPHTEIADIVALSVLAGERAGISRWTMDSIRELPSRLQYELSNVAREAISSLAHDCAREKNNPKGMVKRAQEVFIPIIKGNHAAIIRELNTLAVAAQLERSSTTNHRDARP